MLDAIGIVAKDPKNSLSFYKLLGVTFKPVGEGAPDHFEARLENGLRLMVDSEALIRELNPGYLKPTGSGVVLCFRQPNAKSVDQLFEKITSAGYAKIKAPWDAFWGQRYACVSDPDGNQIDLFADLT